MRHYVNGRMVQMEANPDGTVSSDILRQVAGVPGDRPLILQCPDGSNRIINPGESVMVSPDEVFVDVSAHRRGSPT